MNKKLVRKAVHIIYCVLFMVILVVPIITMNNTPNVVSEIDNRKLANMPVFGEKRFTQDFETYLKERIGGRNEMINAYTVLHDVTVGELTHPNYMYGQDGYVFFHMHDNIQYGDFHKAFVNMVLQIQNYCEARGSYFYFIFDPEKISVYERYLPKGVNYDNSWVKIMMHEMDTLGINYVDNTELLKEKSYDEQVFNVQYDAGHWNDLGCFYATNALLNCIHQDIPEVKELSEDAFEVKKIVETTLPVSEFKIHEEVPDFQLKTPWKDITKKYQNEIAVNPNFPYFHYYVNEAEGAEELPRILFFQGSYYNRGPQFLLGASSEYIGVHNYQNILNLDYYYNIFQPDVVILDAAEYVLSSGYFDLKKMKNLDLNPSLEDEKMTLLPMDGEITVLEGNSVDEVFVEKKLKDAKYSYLTVNEKVFDLKTDKNDNLSASVLNGEITEKDELLLVSEDKNGDKFYMPLTFCKIEHLLKNAFLSKGVDKGKNGVYNIKTDVRENRFNSIRLQLLDAAADNYLQELDSIAKKGIIQDTYVHELETGWYTLCLRANSNLADEHVMYEVYLIQGESYQYTFSVDELKETSARISEIDFVGRTGK